MAVRTAFKLLKGALVLFLCTRLTMASPIEEAGSTDTELSGSLTEPFLPVSTTHISEIKIRNDEVYTPAELEELEINFNIALSDQLDKNHTHFRRQCTDASAFCTDFVEESPYAQCEDTDHAFFVGKDRVKYTICCDKSIYGSTKHDPDGFKCCRTWDFGECDPAHDVVKCLTTGRDGKEHKITPEDDLGTAVCKGAAERSLRHVVAGLAWMLAFWAVCCGFFMAI